MTDILHNLNPAQREAVSAPPGPVLVLAGAGSGKTRVLTHRIAWLIAEKGADPRSVAGMTFTNKAAEEMRGRVETLTGLRGPALLLHTFHALGVRLLREHGAALKLPPGFVILDDDDALALVKSEMRAAGAREDLPGGAGAVLNALSRAKAEGLSPDDLKRRAGNEIEEAVAALYERYERARQAVAGVDFDDLILLPTRLLDEFPAIAGRVRDRIRHLLVDEYQDTSPAQYRFLKALTGPERSVTCVGDPDQSIYRWRGADIRNILEFESDFPDAKVVTMEQNYRSTGRILEAASDLIAHNRQRRPKRLWTEGPAGRPLAVYHAMDETDEARFLAAAVARGMESGARAGSFSVLYRTHAQSRAIEEALSGLRIPYAVVGGVKFYARREVKDMLAYLRLILNPLDGISLARALQAPPRGIGPGSLARLKSVAETEGRPPLETLAGPAFRAALPARARTGAGEFSSLIGRLAAAASADGYAAALDLALDESGYLPWLERRAAGALEGNAAERRENLRELVSAARTAEEEGLDLAGFLERAALLADIDRLGEGEDMVTLMTLHNAKGLEFRHVFICGLEEGLLPHASSLSDPAELEEERRLFYVGLTRARESVTLSTARGRRQYDRFQWVQESRFLEELGSAGVVPVESPEHLPLDESGLPVTGGKRGAGRPACPVCVPARTGRQAGGHTGEPDFTRVRVEDEHLEDAPRVEPGEEVLHEKFGPGRVVSVSGRGPETRVVVQFPRAGRKTLLAGRARLRRLRDME